MAFREISIAPMHASSVVPNSAARLAATAGSRCSQGNASQGRNSLQGHIEEKYIIGDQIGSGMSGQVYACINKVTSEHFAVKIIDTRKFSLNPGQFY
jgi:serine/threonine protein kinase